MHGRIKSTTLLAALLAVASVAIGQERQPAQPQSQGQGQGQGQGQQQPAQQRQMQRAADQNRTAEHERLQQRERDRTQASAAAGQADTIAGGREAIYGGNLMTEQERRQYQERLRAMETDDEREAFMKQHREQMQKRSAEQHVPIEVTTE